MSLLFRINVALAVVFVAAALAAAYFCWAILEDNARRDVLTQAGLMLDSALAMRAYTSSEIDPLLNGQMASDFLPQSVPFYAATQNFLQLRKDHPEYSYKEATLNPTNPRDRATDWEADVIRRFRDQPQLREISSARETPMGKVLFLARPIRADAECAACHGLPSAAPRTLIGHYGTNNGFGWQLHETVGAQIVSVPFAQATAAAERAFRGFLVSLIAVLATVFVAVNVSLHLLVLQPLRRMARSAERVSLGDMSAPAFPESGATEIVILSKSFGRMRKSLAKALQLLEG
jgi:protein-histidine pros-kinase